jgi:ribosome biogenesis SPOUT family RNA methylase Rps3
MRMQIGEKQVVIDGAVRVVKVFSRAVRVELRRSE